ncbi:MAG TPA: IS4 family transposase [Cyanobacteria bacterium UBA11162]|nr:IS4 family transposase [Cyanobacteria bacterium UBA11162]
MNQITSIQKILQPHLGWHGARVNFLALFLIALFRVKTVNFSELAVGFMSQAKLESCYKRLQRFFSQFELDYHTIARFVAKVMEIPEPWVLSIDRTTWEFGGCVFNILVLAVVHNGVAFPLRWWMLDKKGNSNTEERVELLEEFRAIFPSVKVDYLSADREFVGCCWFKYLLKTASTKFRIRIRETDKLTKNGRSLSAKVVFSHLQVGEMQILHHRRRVWGHWVYVVALRLEDGNLLIVATNRHPRSALADYAKRWAIETLFGCFKTRGFCLESTHLQDPDRLSRMIALLTIALCWAFRTGEWLAQQQAILIKSHGRRAKSIFRHGLDYLRKIFLNPDRLLDEFFEVLHFLSCT